MQASSSDNENNYLKQCLQKCLKCLGGSVLSFQVRLVLNPEVETLRLVKVLHTQPQLFAVPRDYNRAMEEQMAKKACSSPSPLGNCALC